MVMSIVSLSKNVSMPILVNNTGVNNGCAAMSPVNNVLILLVNNVLIVWVEQSREWRNSRT